MHSDIAGTCKVMTKRAWIQWSLFDRSCGGKCRPVAVQCSIILRTMGNSTLTSHTVVYSHHAHPSSVYRGGLQWIYYIPNQPKDLLIFFHLLCISTSISSAYLLPSPLHIYFHLLCISTSISSAYLLPSHRASSKEKEHSYHPVWSYSSISRIL
jgi:hypothetical protein